jgi:hypothetical protein
VTANSERVIDLLCRRGYLPDEIEHDHSMIEDGLIAVEESDEITYLRLTLPDPDIFGSKRHSGSAGRELPFHVRFWG